MQTQSVPLISVPPQPGSNTAPDAVAGVGVTAPAAGTVPAAAAGMSTTTGGVAAPGTAPATAPVNRAAPTVGAAPAAGTAAAAAASPGLIPVKPSAVAALPAAPGQGAAPVATAPAVPATVAGAAPAVGAAGGKLVLAVKEDSWVEIRRAGQPNVTRGVVRAGSTQTFNVRADDVLIVGKPGAVSASLAGGKLDLPQGAGKSYALVNIK